MACIDRLIEASVFNVERLAELGWQYTVDLEQPCAYLSVVSKKPIFFTQLIKQILQHIEVGAKDKEWTNVIYA